MEEESNLRLSVLSDNSGHFFETNMEDGVFHQVTLCRTSSNEETPCQMSNNGVASEGCAMEKRKGDAEVIVNGI